MTFRSFSFFSFAAVDLKLESGASLSTSGVKAEEAASKREDLDVKDKENDAAGGGAMAKGAGVKEETKPSTPNPLVKAESGTGIPAKTPLSEIKDKNDNVEITLTLSEHATQNVQVRQLGWLLVDEGGSCLTRRMKHTNKMHI